MERKMKPKLSVIVPIYNVENYIMCCIDSLLCQSLKEIEIILVDDGSSDGCPRICDEMQKRDPRIRVIHKRNEGLGYARNTGLEAAVGEYVAFVDGDDYADPRMCELLYEAAAARQADIAYGGVFYVRGDRIYRTSSAVPEETVIRGEENVRELLLDFIGTRPEAEKDTLMEVSVWKAVFKKEIFDRTGIRFVSERQFISEDLIFDIQFFFHSTCVVIIPECVYYYRMNPDSLSKSYRADRFAKVKELYAYVCRTLSEIYPADMVNLRTDRMLLAKARLICRQNVRHIRKHGYARTYQSLAEICRDPDLERVLKRYPIRRLPLRYGIAAFLMRFKQIHLLILIFMASQLHEK